MSTLLLIVSDVFDITGRGLLLMPDFSVPVGGWKDMSVDCEIVINGGEPVGAVLSLGLAHFNIPGSVDVDRRWRVIPAFRSLDKPDVPIGAQIWVSADVAQALQPPPLGVD